MTVGTPKKTIDQERAAFAWEVVAKVDDLSEAEKKTFGREAKKLPTRILTCGLGQALAFLEAKGSDNKGLKPSHRELLSGLTKFVQPRVGGLGATLLESIVKGDSLLLRRATDEALSLLQWISRFAEARGWTGEEDGEAEENEHDAR